MNAEIALLIVGFISAVAVGIGANLLVDILTRRGLFLAGRSSSPRTAPKQNESYPDLKHTQVYNIVTSGHINIEELPKSDSITINIKTLAEDANLEYRVAVLEGYVEWMLNNGIFSRNIEQQEIEQIRQKAAAVVQERFPHAEVEVKEGQVR